MRIIEKVQQKLFVRYAFEYAHRIPNLDLKAIDGYHLPETVNRFFDTISLQKGIAKLLLDFVLSDEAQTAFAEFGARPIRYVLGDLELPDAAKAKWLPDDKYAGVKQVADWSKIDADKIAATWDEEVLGA